MAAFAAAPVHIDIPNTRSIVKQLLKLSQDPENAAYIVNQGECINGLVNYLVVHDSSVNQMAANAIQLLTAPKQNRAAMKAMPKLLANLHTLHGTKGASARARDFAAAALRNLGEKVAAARITIDDAAAGVSENAENTSPTEKTPGKALRTPAPASYKTAMMTLKIDGDITNEGMRVGIENALIRENGVVSVTIDRDRGVATVGFRGDNGDGAITQRLRRAVQRAVPQGPLLQAMPSPAAATGAGAGGAAKAPAGVLGESGNVPATPGAGGFMKNLIGIAKQPVAVDEGYLDDDPGMQAAISEFAMVSLFGAHSSLGARLDAQRRKAEEDRKRAEEEAAKKEHDKRMLGKVTSALSGFGAWLAGY